jgi:hypothetical protein
MQDEFLEQGLGGGKIAEWTCVSGRNTEPPALKSVLLKTSSSNDNSSMLCSASLIRRPCILLIKLCSLPCIIVVRIIVCCPVDSTPPQSRTQDVHATSKLQPPSLDLDLEDLFIKVANAKLL